MTIVIITHEMNVIKEICDTVAVIEEARIVETGPVIDLFTRPRTPTARRFISTVINAELPPSLSLAAKRQRRQAGAGLPFSGRRPASPSFPTW
ncbi:MAG: hypothetical protein ACOX37_06620 [Bacillota bacterium]